MIIPTELGSILFPNKSPRQPRFCMFQLVHLGRQEDLIAWNATAQDATV